MDIALIVFYLSLIVMMNVIAGQKNRSRVVWTILAVVAPFVSMIVLFFLPTVRGEESTEEVGEGA